MVLVWGGEVGVVLLGACRLSGEKVGGGEKVFGGVALFFFFFLFFFSPSSLFSFLVSKGVGGVIAAYLYVDTWTSAQIVSE